MAIYGTALLAGCMLIGLSLGRWIGGLCGMDKDIGGVGIAMLLLIVSTDYLQRTGRMRTPTESGIAYWGSIYVPIVVAMSASQNVLGALSGGVVAVLAGVISVAACFSLVGLLSRFGQPPANEGD